MKPAALALIYHDPQGTLHDHWRRLLPTLNGIFAGIAVRGSATAHRPTLDFLAGHGVLVYQEPGGSGNARPHIGRGRRKALELALSLGQPAVMYCDGDRMLHWAEHYEAELTAVPAHLSAHDFTVFGRTPRAFATHPRSQQDTEGLVNELYGRISGHNWDVLAAARGLSRRAAEFILAHSTDDEISTDVSWPLLLQQRQPAWTQAYFATEGLEYETIAQVLPEVARAGGPDAWLAALDADPQEWVKRLELARVMAAAMTPFSEQHVHKEALV